MFMTTWMVKVYRYLKPLVFSSKVLWPAASRTGRVYLQHWLVGETVYGTTDRLGMHKFDRGYSTTFVTRPEVHALSPPIEVLIRS